LSSELGARANEVEALKVALVDREKRAAALDHALTEM
jgi:hypothetical protein